MTRLFNIIPVAVLVASSTALLHGCDGSGSTPPPPPATVVSGAQNPAAKPAATPQQPHASTDQASTPATANATSKPPVAPLSVPDNPKVASFAGLTAPKPATWTWQPPQRQFAVAEYAVPGADGADQARIVAFGAIGGTLEQNISRWKGQFTWPDGSPVEPKISTLEAGGMAVTIIELSGHYMAMGAVSPTPETLFITAAIQSPQGQIFVRLVGPHVTVERHRADFMDMIKGLHKVDQ